jgi:hypothetical protein
LRVHIDTIYEENSIVGKHEKHEKHEKKEKY